MDYFTLNCQLQGVDLKRDADPKKDKPVKGWMTDAGLMMKIREK